MGLEAGRKDVLLLPLKTSSAPYSLNALQLLTGKHSLLGTSSAWPFKRSNSSLGCVYQPMFFSL